MTNDFCFSRAMPDLGAIRIFTATARDLPEATECCYAAFTRFEVFGPPWQSDAGSLPALLQAFPHPLIRIAVDTRSEAICAVVVWIPRTLHCQGKSVSAAFLAPLAVHPDWQGRGLGSLLMQDSIAQLRQQQVELLYLMGHPAYYPRFGFVQNCLGQHAIRIDAPQPVAELPCAYHLRPLHAGDASFCTRLWRQLCADTDGAVEPEPGLLEWSANPKGIIAAVLERNAKPVAYARFDTRPGATPEDGIRRFLAADAEAAEVLAGQICTWAKWQPTKLVLPLPSRSRAVQSLFPEQTLEPLEQGSPAGMAMALNAGTCAALLLRIAAREAPPLFIEWPALLDR